ncbi:MULTISPECIES: hypothetical protein [Rhizobium]|uniref:hypothetical protein n=1 Tax=Rhizobium TaxID=379 RepID=UPI001FE16A81|nr:hypothetical protein [Rhizobium azibense]
MPSAAKKPVTPDNGVGFEQDKGAGWIGKMCLASIQRSGYVFRDSVYVDFQA